MKAGAIATQKLIVPTIDILQMQVEAHGLLPFKDTHAN